MRIRSIARFKVACRRAGLLAAALLVFATTASATNVILAAWQANYPTSQSAANAARAGASCLLCHVSPFGGNGWNGYGWAVRQRILAADPTPFTTVEPADSDADPTASSNLLEIKKNTQPGWTPGAHNTHYFANGSTIVDQNPPAGISGNLDPVNWMTMTPPLLGTFGHPVFFATDGLTGGLPNTWTLSSAPPSGLAFLVVGLANISMPFKGGTLLPSLDIILGLPIDPTGHSVLNFIWPTGLPSGLNLFVQYWIKDPGGPAGFAASNGEQGTTN